MKRISSFVITFNNGFTKIETKITLEQLIQLTAEFALYHNDKNESCYKVPYTVRKATDIEIKTENDRIDKINTELKNINFTKI